MENIDIETVLRTNPFLALDFPDIETIALKYLPYSVGMEFECDYAEIYDENALRSIPDLIEVNTGYEKKFRIPNGIKGLCCLYNIAEIMKFNCVLSESGIHYHVDFSDDFKGIYNEPISYYNYIINNYGIIEDSKEFLLQELDKWEYPNTYNKRDVVRGKGPWVSLRDSYRTFEFRIGEMTFDYELLVKRIMHISLLSSLIKDKAMIFNNGTYLTNIETEENIKKTIESRTINIYNVEPILEEIDI